MNLLRLALMYLRFMPSQRWVALTAALMMAAGLLMHEISVFLLGAVLLVFFPAMFGGIAMRMVSSGSSLRLRPDGHRQLLLSGLLCTVLLAAMHVGPVLAAIRLGWLRPTPDFPIQVVTITGAARYALLAWSIIASSWLAMFCIVSVPLLGLLLALAPPLLLSVSPGVVAFLDGLSVPFAAFPLLVATAWVVFAAWYLRVRVLRNPVALTAAVLLRLQGRGQPQHSAAGHLTESRNVALRTYLTGSTSWKDLMLGFSISLVSLAPLALIAARRPGPRPLLAMVFAMLFAMGGPILAFSGMRRARFLWLKAGVDRTALFGIVERLTALGTAIFVLVFAAALVLVTMLVQPQALPVLLLFGLAFAAFSFSMMYAAFCFVHPWTPICALPVLLCVAGWGYMVWRLLPSSDPRFADFSVAILASVVLAAVLRLIARRRWRAIDWQLLRPYVIGTPGRGIRDA